MDVEKLPSRAFDSAAAGVANRELIGELQPSAACHSGTRSPVRSPCRRTHPAHRHALLRVAAAGAHRRHVAAAAHRNLPSDTRWWEFNDDPKWSALAVAFGVVDCSMCCPHLRFHACAQDGIVRLLALLYVVRSLFLGTLENPEPRYTLEMYPIVIVLAAAALQRKPASGQQKLSSE